MMADAFSMFDYGGSMGLVALVSWTATGISFVLIMNSLGVWIAGDRLLCLLIQVAEIFGREVLGGTRMIFGFSLFCISLFFYLSFVGVYSLFPYLFCMTAHFSHNFCISMVMWFATLILNMIISAKGFMVHFIPSGLSWWQAVPVGLFEMISNLSRLITLGARLTMNMIAGKLLLCVGSVFYGAMFLNGMAFSLGGLSFLLLLLALTSWEMVVGIIQAYIFTFLSVTYVSEAPVYGGDH